jgi:hypothetical protein
MKIEKGMILSSLSILSSPLVSFLKNSKMAPEPVAGVEETSSDFFFLGERD